MNGPDNDVAATTAKETSDNSSKELIDYLVRKGQESLSASSHAIMGSEGVTDKSDVSANTSKVIKSEQSAGEGASAKAYNIDRAKVRTLEPEYGNYFTVSGTNAEALRKTFAKSYRSPADSKTRRLLAASGVRFSSPKDSICEDEQGESTADGQSQYRNRSDSKSLMDVFRRRNKSGPVPNPDGSAEVKPKGTARVRTFFDSFRSRPRSISVSYAPVEHTASSTAATLSSPPPQPAAVGKKKKFKVTPASLIPGLKKSEHVQRMCPEEFVDMYCRARTSSDPRSHAFLKAQIAANARKKSQQQQQQHHHQQKHGENLQAVSGERRRSDPNLHEAEILNASTSNYATVTGLSALRLSNYPKLNPLAPSSEVHNSRVVEPVRMIIWKDKKKGTKVFKLPGYYESYLGSGSEELMYVRFAKSRSCYDVMPYSSKLVIFDTQLNVKKAFVALVQNGVRAAALWDSKQQDFVGMFTVTDFIHILQKYYRSPQERISELEEQRIAQWRDVLGEVDRPLVSVGPSDSLLTALHKLYHGKVHRLLVVNSSSGNALHVLTYKRILRFVHLTLRNMPPNSLMCKTLAELEIGSFENIATATPDTPLIEALNKFVERRVSALPILNADGCVVDIYTKFDVMDLISDQAYSNLDVSLLEAMKSRHEGFETVRTCKKSDKLFDVLENIVSAEVHRLVVVDDAGHIEGIVSLSDLFKFMVILPYDNLESSMAELEEPASVAEDSQVLTDDTGQHAGEHAVHLDTVFNRTQLEANATLVESLP